jgi:glycosyltransferase 2 family protein
MSKEPLSSAIESRVRADRAQRQRTGIIGYAVALACLVWLFHDIKFTEVFFDIRAIDWRWVAAAVLLDIVSYVCQGWRWGLLLHPLGHLSILQTSQAIYAGLFVNEILPMRLGEVLRIFLASRRLRTNFAAVVSSVLVERFFDAIWLALAVAAIVLRVPLPRYLVGAEETLAGIVITALVLFAFLVIRRPGPPGELRGTFGFMGRLSKAVEALAAGVRDVGRSRFVYAAFWISSLVLALQILSFWFVMRACGLDFSFWHGAAVLLIVHLGTSIPSAPANLGTYQFFTVIMLTQFGVEKTTATGFSMVVFIILTIPLWVIGFYALVRAGVTLRQVRTDIYRLAKR